MRILVLAQFMGFSSFLSFAHASVDATLPTPKNQASSALVAPWDGVYVFDNEARLTPTSVLLNGEVHDNATGVSVEFSANEPVAVSREEDGSLKVVALLDEDERGETPEAFFVAAEDFAAAQARFAKLGDEATLARDFSGYETTVTASRGWPRSRHRRRHGRIGHCAGYVKRRLGVHVRGNGRDVAGALARIGFQRVSCENPRVGTVASWRGGWHGLGHTGIWNGRCFAYDRGCGNPGSNYRLVGCVHR